MATLPRTVEEWQAALDRLDIHDNVFALQRFHSELVKEVVRPLGDIFEEIEADYLKNLERAEPSNHEARHQITEWRADQLLERTETRQVILNLLAIGLYHVFEQQQVTFFRQLLARTSSEGKAQEERRVKKLERMLRSELGLSEEEFPFDEGVQLLEAVANAIKHGEGRSAERVRRCRPDLFENPVWQWGDPEEAESPGEPRDVTPLRPGLEGGLYVTEEQMRQWCDDLEVYWTQWLTLIRYRGPG